AQQNGEDLVRVDKVAILVGGADAVGVAVGAKAGVAVVGNHRLAQRANVRLDGLGVDAGEERIDVAADLHVIDTDPREDVGEDRKPGAVHGVDGKLETRLGDEIEVG